MRKYNSSFKTAFVSEAGNRLKNNDYFGFVELDRYACYVIADGITDMRDAAGAREAIGAVIEAFQRAPGISGRKVKSYLKYANGVLLKGESYEKLKASVTVVVSDYQKFRYGHAGNTRLRLYRDGRAVLSSADMSLSQDMAERGELTEDRIARHEERNNLFAWLGKPHFKPYISKKIKLSDGDIITLYTRGIWENVDEGELADVFAEAGSEPAEECDRIEDLLLSRQPQDLDNYTFVSIYVDKVFKDPERRKRIKKAAAIAVIAVVIVAAAALALFLWHRDRQHRREDMAQYFADAQTYIEDNNFPRAKEECEKALEAARKLRDKELAGRYSSYVAGMEALNGADELFAAGDYTQAKEAYLTARARVRHADNAGLGHIEGRLAQIGSYEQVFDLIELGDSLFERDDYEMAEAKYMDAKKKAAAVYFDTGKQQALDALDKLYAEWSAVREEEAQLKKEQEQKNEEMAAQQAADEAAAAELVKQGDAAFGEGDCDGANVFYLIALEKYSALEDTVQLEYLNKKMQAVKEKQQEIEDRTAEAKKFEEQARLYEAEKDYAQAVICYQYVKAVYLEIGKESKANETQEYIDMLENKQAKEEKEQEEEKEEAEKKSQEEEKKKEEEEKKRLEEEKEKEEEAACTQSTEGEPVIRSGGGEVMEMEEKSFGHKAYIQEHLRGIDSLDERRYAKELLLDALGGLFAWTEAKYGELERRVQEELDVPWEHYGISMTVIDRKDYDPINGFWHPVCETDTAPGQGCLAGNPVRTVYLAAGEKECREFLGMGTVVGTDAGSGEKIHFRISRAQRYEECMRKLYGLFARNGVPWQTVHMGYLERFFDLAPQEEIPEGADAAPEFGRWEGMVLQDRIPLWNIEKAMVQPQEFRRPCLDGVIYEHICYLENTGQEGDGYLAEAADGDILSVRYEKNRVILKTEKETLENVCLYRLHQGDRGDSYGYGAAVLSNRRKDNFAARYLQKTGNFIQTPAELYRKAEALSGNFRIRVSGCRITDSVQGQEAMEGGMNAFAGVQVFSRDERRVLLIKFGRDGSGAGETEYLYEAQVRYILSQLQLEFPEYRCMGVWE